MHIKVKILRQYSTLTHIFKDSYDAEALHYAVFIYSLWYKYKKNHSCFFVGGIVLGAVSYDVHSW